MKTTPITRASTATLLIQHFTDLSKAMPEELAADLVKQASHHLLASDGLCVHIETSAPA